MTSWLIGIDEAGRGPLAGPVAVGLVKIPVDFDWRALPGVGDSKQITKDERERIFKAARQLEEQRLLQSSVVQMSATYIDTYGIARAIAVAIKKGLKEIQAEAEACHIKLDGALRAPKQYSQETIIKGDSSELVIGLASILAKVTRDQYMTRVGKQKKYAQYNFAQHKGYGTPEHRRLIALHGLCTEHRESYCQNQHLWSKL